MKKIAGWVYDERGFGMERKGRNAVVYFEGEHKLTLPIEASADGHGWTVFLSTAEYWDPPFELERLSTAGRGTVRERLLALARFANIEPDFM